MSKSTESLNKLRDLPSDELTAALTTTRDELFRLKLGSHTNQVASTASIGTKRREVARILTILHARANGSETHAAAKTESAPAASKAKKPAAAKPAKATKATKASK